LQRSDLALVLSFACLFAIHSGPALAEPKAIVQGDLDRSLRADIVRAIGEAKAPAESGLDARRRARDAAADAVSLLRSEGYYDNDVVPDVSDGEPPHAILKVTPGPRFTFAPATVAWIGEAPAEGAERASEKAMDVRVGAPGRAAAVLAAEGRAIAELQKRGYADARSEPRVVTVDYADHTVQAAFKIDAGPLVKLGRLKVLTAGHTSERWVASLAPWKRGAVYDPALLAKLERRLTETGAYESATVALAPADQSAQGFRPVQVTLAERPRRTLELGAALATTGGSGLNAASSTTGGSSFGAYTPLQGSGVDGKWIHYNLLHRADTLTLTARLYDIQQVLDLQLSLPDWMRADQTLKIGADGLNEQTPAYNDSGAGLRLDVERHWTKTTFATLGGYVDYVSLLEKNEVNAEGTPVGQHLNLFIPTLLAAAALDRSNDPLNPIRGWRFEARAEPTLITGERSLAYVSTQAQVSGYFPFDRAGDTVLAGRFKMGSILGGSIPDVPADRRFYAGGGGSVRGYAYQAVGPRLSDNTPEGGLSLTEASVELRRQITRQWGVVAFVDVGSVGTTSTPSFQEFSTGVGIGLRYDLGFGPFRLDVATPVNPRQGDAAVQVYLSIGQAF